MRTRQRHPFSGRACPALCITLTVVLSVRAAPETQPSGAGSDDAAMVYLQAAKAIRVDSPSETIEVFPEYPPYSEDWRRAESAAWNANTATRRLARSARQLPQATWPIEDRNYMASLFRLAHDLTDAALYADYQGNSSEAVEINRDLLHLSDLLEANPRGAMDRVEFGRIISSYAAVSLLRIASGIEIASGRTTAHGLPANEARDLIAKLLEQPDPISQLAQVEGVDKTTLAKQLSKNDKERIDFINLANVQETFVAISLACHVFKSDKGRWPKSLDELIPAYLPRPIVDPWGDGKQTFGYILIVGGLPDGSDRAMIYCRCQSNDGLFYRVNEPCYSFSGEGGMNPKYGGQFRDVARWQPMANYNGPTTRPLP